jgi:hypothetical protein
MTTIQNIGMSIGPLISGAIRDAISESHPEFPGAGYAEVIPYF